MASTYSNSLRLELIASGEAASTWGDKTNVNLTNIAAAFGYATQDGFAANADSTTTVADGVADPARAMYFKVTSSATLTATRTLTIAPNTISRLMWIENATTGGQSIAISQGTGANVTIPTGKTAVVYLDGAGSGAAVVDAMAGVSSGASDTLAEILAAGNATGGTDIAVGTGDDITFADNAKAVFGAGSDLQIFHDGSHSYISDTGTGDLRINGASNVDIRDTTGVKTFRGVSGGEAILYHNNDQKLATTSTGIDITGTATMDGLTVTKEGTDHLKIIDTSSSNALTVGIGNTVGSVAVDPTGSVASSKLDFSIDGNTAFRIAEGGDISFYEDTGTTAKFFWDASAESLGIGTSSPSDFAANANNLVVGSGSGTEGITINSGTANYGVIYFADGTSGSAAYAGNINYNHADNSMRLGTNGSTTDVAIDSLGNVGLGAVPDAWSTSSTAIQIGSLALEDYVVSGANVSNILNNAFRNSSGNVVYKESDFASSYGQYNGEHIFNVAASGTAGDTISFTNAMRIDSSGNVGIGTDSPNALLELKNSSSEIRLTDSSDDSYTRLRYEGQAFLIEVDDASGAAGSNFRIQVDGSEAMRITSDAELRTSSAVVVGRIADRQAQTVGVTDATLLLAGNSNSSAAGDEIGKVAFYNQDASTNGHNLAATIKALASTSLGADADLVFSTKRGVGEGAEALESMRIDSSGNVGIGTSSPASILAVDDTADKAYITQTNSQSAQTLKIGNAYSILGSSLGSFGAIDADTGLLFGTGGSEAMRITAEGNFLVRQSSAAVSDTHNGGSVEQFWGNQFSSSNSTNTKVMMGTGPSEGYVGASCLSSSGKYVVNSYLRFDNTNATAGSDAGQILFFTQTGGTNAAERMRIDSSGAVKINGGVLELGGEGVVSGNIHSQESLYINSDSNGTPEASPIVFGRGRTGSSGGTEDMRLDGAGNLLVGTTTTSSVTGGSVQGMYLDGANGEINISSSVTTGDNQIKFHNPNGRVGSISTSGTSTTYSTSSDQRLKDNIVDAPSASDDIDAIQVRSFDWKADGLHQKYGMVAQELQSVAPEAVTGDADSDEMMGVDYSKLVPMMLKEIQSLRARVAQLES